jgi:hypothetical protein
VPSSAGARLNQSETPRGSINLEIKARCEQPGDKGTPTEVVLRRAYCVLRQSGGTARLNLEIAVLNLEIAPSVCCDRAVAPRDPSRDQGVRGRRITPVEEGGGGLVHFWVGGTIKARVRLKLPALPTPLLLRRLPLSYVT